MSVIKEIYNDWQSGELDNKEALQYMKENIKDSELLSKIDVCDDEIQALNLIESEYALAVFN
jgi:hypothetical protein